MGKRLLLGLCLFAGLGQLPVAAEPFVVPPSTTWATWEAEAAAVSGQWRTVTEPAASQGRYLQTDDRDATLQFRFHADQETTLRVRPVWWRTSQTRSARRFPYPLPQQYGPEALLPVGDKVYFLCPAARHLGLLDTSSEGLTRRDLSGYPTDLAYDAAANCLYVTSATENCVLVLSPAGDELRRLKTAAQPWALALVGDQLYVACRQGRCVQRLDPRTGAVAQTVPCDAEPVGLEVTGTPPSSLTIRFQQHPVQMQTLEVLEPDQVQYNQKPTRTYVALNRSKHYEADRAKPLIRVIRPGGGTTSTIDLAGPGSGGQPPSGLPGYPLGGDGPTMLLLSGDKLFYCLAAAGRVGVIDTKTDQPLKTLELGGYPVDLASNSKRDKLYVADAATSTVCIVDVAKFTVTGRIKVPAGPVNLQLVETYDLQRPYLVPGLPIQRLFVACYGDQSLGVIDLKTDQLVQTVPLGYRPRLVKLVPSPNPDWWPTMADDRIPLALLPKLAVEPVPATLDLASGQLRPAVDAGEGLARRGSAKLTVGGVERTISSNGNLLLQVTAPPDVKRNIDCSSLGDPGRSAAPPIEAGDQPGSITVSLDRGPDYDWRRGLWTRPDNGTFLVNGSEEYWRFNAPAFRVAPGDHVLTVKARDGAVGLDAVAVQPTAAAALELTVRPEPWALHSSVPSGAYQGVFYDTEPVKFTVSATNTTAQPLRATLTGTITNYLGETRPLPVTSPLDLAAAGTANVPLDLALQETGRFTLTLSLRTAAGEVTRDVRFVRVPKLEHPRLLFRADQTEAIRRRLAAHPLLFKRYAAWLLRMTAKEGKFPERFLPNGVTQEELAKAAPAGVKDPGQQYGWRMYELGWRFLGAQFAARYIPGADQATLDARLKPLLTAPQTNKWVQYHHHGPFFPGAVEGLVDMAPAEQQASLPLKAFFAQSKGDINVYPFTLMSLEPPLSPADRALIYRVAIQHDNLDRYVTAHAGSRGGTWWQNPWSWCYCPTQGLFLSQMYTANFLGERRWAEKPFFRSYLTFVEQADPLSDKAGLLPSLRRPSGEPWRWILTAVTRHPLEKSEYGWDEWLKKMEGPLPNEDQAVDDLMALKGMPLAGPLEAAPHRFATAVSVPVALALGWYEPTAPTVTWKDLPPTTVLDPEGWVRMRSGWGPTDTELWFMSGVRDHTTRHQPNHFMVARGGQFLVGFSALWADDGNCTPSWGNTVVAGDRWLPRWQLNLNAPRAEEKAQIDRFSPVNWSYLRRETQLNGYNPAESGWGGGLDLHGHTETLMTDDGRLTAYETWPEFDYVAGETTGAWPVEEIRSHQRQLVFLKPNVLVVYDRVKLGPQGRPSHWLAATGPDLTINGQTFSIAAGDAKLAGQVLLPRNATVAAVKPPAGYPWKKQQVLQLSSPSESDETEYLVVMTTGAEKLYPAQATVDLRPDAVSVGLRCNGRQYTVRLNRRGPVGGHLAFSRGKALLQHDLPTRIEDTYRHWSSDPRYKQWITEPRFDFIIPAGDRAPAPKR